MSEQNKILPFRIQFEPFKTQLTNKAYNYHTSMGVLWNWTVGDLGSIKFWTGAHGIGLPGSVIRGSFVW